MQPWRAPRIAWGGREGGEKGKGKRLIPIFKMFIIVLDSIGMM